MNKKELEKSISNLLKTNKITKGTDHFTIYLNFPDDFIFSINEIKIICYFDGKYDLVSDCIPENIKNNMLNFKNLEIFDFIKFLEKNLNIFLSNKIPEVKEIIYNKNNLKPFQLSDNFKFPTHSNVTLNIKYDIYKSNILIFCCEKLNLIVKCLKCQTVNNIKESQSCKGCPSLIGFKYVPVVNDEFLGFLQLSKCDFLFFNPLKYQYKCYDCDIYYETKELNFGDTNIQKCYGCFKEMKFKVNLLEYYKKRDFKIVEGTELPDKGTCKHYKKSFRWLRFLCCNSLYPCDICHDEITGHPNMTANRMVCGLCSKEQSVKCNCDCGMNLVKKKTSFWEGGKGNRDKNKLSRKDSKKYK